MRSTDVTRASPPSTRSRETPCPSGSRNFVARELRHRRAHGRARARRTGLRVRGEVRHPDRSSAVEAARRRDLGAVLGRGAGRCVDSGPFTGLETGPAREAIANATSEHGIGGKRTRYRLRDWLISRQRYWGLRSRWSSARRTAACRCRRPSCPCASPRTRPGEGQPARKGRPFLDTTCPKCGEPAKRETDTMDTFVDSSWYYLRYRRSERGDDDRRARRAGCR